MTLAEKEAYFETLDDKQISRFNLLVETSMLLGKSPENAYDYAKGIMEGKKS